MCFDTQENKKILRSSSTNFKRDGPTGYMCFDTQAFFSLSLSGLSHHSMRQSFGRLQQGFFVPVDFLPCLYGQPTGEKPHLSDLKITKIDQSHKLDYGRSIPQA